MTKDEFRKFQKAYCVSGAPNKAGMYGCRCCRKIGFLNHFKKWARDMAKTEFRRETKKLIQEEM